MSKRNLHVFGQASPDAKISVVYNNRLIKSGAVDHNIKNIFNSNETLLFSLETDVLMNGSFPVEITVVAGNITVGRTMFRYPALLKKQPSIQGYVWFYQPIVDSKLSVLINDTPPFRDEQDKNLTGEWNYYLDTNDVMTYLHLVYNGPARWTVPFDVEVELFQNNGIHVHYDDLLKMITENFQQ